MLLDGYNSRVKITENRISELENRATGFYSIQTKEKMD